MAKIKLILSAFLILMMPVVAPAQLDLRKTDLYIWIESGETSWTNVRRIQRTLQRLGYRPGLADGVFGPRTQQAIADWQTASGLPISGLGLPPGAVPASKRSRCAGGLLGPLSGIVRHSGGACY